MLELKNTEPEAESIIDAAKEKAAKIISESEIMKGIQRKAEELKAEFVSEYKSSNKSLFLTNYEEIKKIIGSDSLYAIMNKNRKWGVIDFSGKIITDFKYDDITGISAGDYELIMVYKDGKHGFVTLDGKEIIPPEYECPSAFFGGKAEVTKNGERFFINIKNERI